MQFMYNISRAKLTCKILITHHVTQTSSSPLIPGIATLEFRSSPNHCRSDRQPDVCGRPEGPGLLPIHDVVVECPPDDPPGHVLPVVRSRTFLFGRSPRALHPGALECHVPGKEGHEVPGRLYVLTWWRHQMETFSALLANCAGNSPVTGEFPAQRPVTRSFDIFIDLRLNTRLSKQSWSRWFETL